MKLIDRHIELYLNRFVGIDELDLNIFNRIDNYSKKKRLLKLLKYVDKLFNLNPDYNSNKADAIHIHFESEFNRETEIIIMQLIIAKLFKIIVSENNV